MSEAFQKGWYYFSKTAGTGFASTAGQTYCEIVRESINTFSSEMNKMVLQHGNLGVGQCKGFVAESWHANTFNINAALRESDHKAFVDQSRELGSVDVSTNFGSSYSMKYLGSAEQSSKAQAKNYYENYYEYLKKPRNGDPLSWEDYLKKYNIDDNPEVILKSVYSGQYRVIPREQLNDAVKHLERLIEKEQEKTGPNRALVYKNYLETLNKLTDRIVDGDGVESIPLDKESAETIVNLCREGTFKAEDFGIDMSKLVTSDYIIQQALKAGYSAAVISLVIEVAPKICELLIDLIREEKIEEEQIKKIGFAALKGSTLGFIRGYIASALTIACQSGKLGKQLMNIPGNAIAAITVLLLDTVRNAWLVASGKITLREMSVKTEDAAVVTMGALIGGSIGVALLPQLTVLSYMIGSFVGSVIGGLVAIGKNYLIMALCADNGITLFGLVDQDYTLSKEMIKSLGLNLVDLKVNELKRNELNINQIKSNELKRNELKKIEIVTLKRGVIGVRRIGYI